MTPQEFDYIRRANEVLQDPKTTTMTAAKISRVISQIYQRQAEDLELAIVELVDRKIERNYQDLQNRKLVDILSK